MDNKMDEGTVGLRNLLFEHRSKDLLGDEALSPEQIWGLVMETTYDDMSATVFCLADGSTSLYYSNGGGILGAGEQGEAKELAAVLACYAPLFFVPYAEQEICKDFPYPSKGNVHFYFLSDLGSLKTDEVEEDTLGNNQHILSPLFHAVHMLIGIIIENQSPNPN